MSRSYWLPIVAVVGLIFAGPIEGKGVLGHSGGSDAASHGNGKANANLPPSLSIAVQNDIKRVASALEAANNKQPSTADKQQAQANLKAQQDMAKWAGRMFIVGLLEMVVTAAGVFLVWRTLKASWAAAKETKRTADASVKALEQSERHAVQELRAYVFVEKRRFKLLEGTAWQAEIRIKNGGATPAYSVKSSIDAWIGDDPPETFDTPDNDKGELCLAPDDSFSMYYEFNISESEIERIRGSKVSVYVAGVVKYIDAFGQERRTRHQSFMTGLDIDAPGGIMSISDENNRAD